MPNCGSTTASPPPASQAPKPPSQRVYVEPRAHPPVSASAPIPAQEKQPAALARRGGHNTPPRAAHPHQRRAATNCVQDASRPTAPPIRTRKKAALSPELL